MLVGYDSLGVKKFSHALVGACFLTLPSATIRLNRCGKTALKPYGGCSDKIFKQLRNSCLGNFECIAFQEYNASGRLLQSGNGSSCECASFWALLVRLEY